ncbi:MAG TPA: YfiR family protein [Flavisolibacter sp.]|nr:YfiR family protein [Flavisolibacter sp.]
MLLVLLWHAVLFSPAQAPTAANQIKAVFLYNFTQFVNWPPSSLGNSNTPFVIGVLGTDPFGSYLENVVEGERVEGHPIVVQRFADAKEVRYCQILFINKSNAAEIAKNLNNDGMLTVSDAENFATGGGMIRFYLENNKIRFQINTRAARAANLTISSKLLRLASVLDNQP